MTTGVLVSPLTQLPWPQHVQYSEAELKSLALPHLCSQAGVFLE